MKEILEIILDVLGILTLFVGGLWAYSKFIVERGFFPAANLTLECKIIGIKNMCKIIEMSIHIKNQGSTTLTTDNVYLSLKTINKNDPLTMYLVEKLKGRLKFFFPSESDELQFKDKSSFYIFRLVPHTTFVQPGIDQKYSFTTIMPEETEFLWAQAKFTYAYKPQVILRGVLWISRKLGLVQFTFRHLTKPHTAEAVFNLNVIQE